MTDLETTQVRCDEALRLYVTPAVLPALQRSEVTVLLTCTTWTIWRTLRKWKTVRSEVKASSRSEISRPPPWQRAGRVGSASPESGLSHSLYPDIWRDAAECFTAHTEFISSRSLLRLQASLCCGSHFFFKTTEAWKSKTLTLKPSPQYKSSFSAMCLEPFSSSLVSRGAAVELSDLNVNWWLWLGHVFVPLGSSRDCSCRIHLILNLISNTSRHTFLCLTSCLARSALCSFCPLHSKQTDSVYIYMYRAQRRCWTAPWAESIDHNGHDRLQQLCRGSDFISVILTSGTRAAPGWLGRNMIWTWFWKHFYFPAWVWVSDSELFPVNVRRVMIDVFLSA